MTSTRLAAGLLGRDREQDALDRLVGQVRAGTSAVLVLRGEAGIGKTALLEYVRTRASGCRIATASGVESEMELLFAGLHQLCTPMREGLVGLPEPQHSALRAAFGLQAGATADRFLIGLAVLTLLSVVSAERPLLCLVDDGQWLDEASMQALGFVARRLMAEPIGLVFAVREPSDDRHLRGLPQMEIHGLDEGAARQVLATALPGPLEAQVQDRIIAESRGNPLALLEFPGGLAPGGWTGGYGTPGATQAARRIERSYALRLRYLPAPTRQLLLLAAAEPLGDVTMLWEAAALLGVDPEAAIPAVDARLLELGPRVRFHHPLVRSAVYRAATVDERRKVHSALASVTPVADADRRGWHRALAVTGPDEHLAAELARVADQAEERGGVAAAAAFLARATELTPDPALRGARGLTAAAAKARAGIPTAALELLATAELGPLDDLQRARADLLRARISLDRRRGRDAPPLLLAAARRLGPLDVHLARDAYLDALDAAIVVSGPAGGALIRDVAAAARDAPTAPDPQRPIDLLLDGLAIRFTEGYARAVPVLRRALDGFHRQDDPSTAQSRWQWLACRVAADLWDDDAWHHLAVRAVQVARDTGAIASLPLALAFLATVHVCEGEFETADALLVEAETLGQTAGAAPPGYVALSVAAWRGRPSEAAEVVTSAVRNARARGEDRVLVLADYCASVVNNGLGRYEDALAAASRAAEHDQLYVQAFALLELIEAATRSGHPEMGAAALPRLEEKTMAAGTNWAVGIVSLARALVDTGPTAGELYRQAIDSLSHTRITAQLARARLLYGEWLRRENRRLDAREELRAAHDLFSRMGAEAFADRARRELQATGEVVHRPTADRFAALTAQEAQISRLAREGRTNPEIGAQLFLSPRTVEWHLRNVFTKLGITSRRELRAVLPDAGHGVRTP